VFFIHVKLLRDVWMCQGNAAVMLAVPLN